jgi:hypothetical protein
MPLAISLQPAFDDLNAIRIESVSIYHGMIEG